MPRTNSSVPATILEIDLPESSWPSNLETTGDYLAVQIHASNKSWTVLLYKDRGDKASSGPCPGEDQQQIQQIAMQLASMGGRLIKQSEHPPSALPDLDPDDLETLIRGATIHVEVSGEFRGSGVVTEIRGKKYVLTAGHCITPDGPRWVCFTTLEGESWGQVNHSAGLNDSFDVAAFPLPEWLAHLPAVPLLEDEVPVGQTVHLSGFPRNCYRITTGEVRQYSKEGTELVHSAPSASGSSGGMLITPQGYLCGIHTGKYSTAAPWSSSASPSYLRQFAIPSSLIMRLVKRYDW
jgi:hypothetical protein